MGSNAMNEANHTSSGLGNAAPERTLLHHEIIAENPNAPWLVFIHGAGGSIRTWKFQIEAFAPHYRLLLIDLRDHGYSKEIMPAFPAYDFDIVAKDILAVFPNWPKNKLYKMEFASRSMSRLVARPGIFRLFMKGKFDPYVL